MKTDNSLTPDKGRQGRRGAQVKPIWGGEDKAQVKNHTDGGSQDWEKQEEEGKCKIKQEVKTSLDETLNVNINHRLDRLFQPRQ